MKTASLPDRVVLPGPTSLAYLAFAAIRRVRGRHLVIIDAVGLAAAAWLALDIPAGTAVRFEPGQTRRVSLVAFAGARVVHGFRGEVEGPL